MHVEDRSIAFKTVLSCTLSLFACLTLQAARADDADFGERADGPPMDEARDKDGTDSDDKRSTDAGSKDSADATGVKTMDNRFDGSEYNPSTFQDTDFHKESYIDLLLKSKPKKKEKKISQPPPLDLLDWQSADDGVFLSADDKKMKDKHYDEFRAILRSPPIVKPDDWLPGALDPITNGGFTIAPDNGSPVPYRLNGHVNIQRGRPWLHSD